MRYTFAFLRDYFSTTGKSLAEVKDGYTLTRFDGGYPVSSPVQVWQFANLAEVRKHASTFGA